MCLYVSAIVWTQSFYFNTCLQLPGLDFAAFRTSRPCLEALEIDYEARDQLYYHFHGCLTGQNLTHATETIFRRSVLGKVHVMFRVEQYSHG